MAEEKLTPAQRSKIRRLSAYKEPEAGEEAGELNVVPFLDMIMNIMMFVLATVAVTFTATLETSPPSAGGKGSSIRPTTQSLNLTLILTAEGISIKAAGGSIAPGCTGAGGGITFPTKGKDQFGDPIYDYQGLNACVTKLKSESPDFKDERQIRITASNNISYRRVIDCIDAVRTDKEGKELFPEILFGMFR